MEISISKGDELHEDIKLLTNEDNKLININTKEIVFLKKLITVQGII